MFNEFFITLTEAEAWFFGDLLLDPFISFVINVFNTLMLLTTFYSLLLYPVKYCIKLFKKFLRSDD